jgi:gliding motility-associated protein GldM
VESSSNDSVKYKFVDTKINKFEDQDDLKKQILELYKSKKWQIHQSDSAVVMDTYIALSKNEMVPNEHEEGQMEHWIGKTFNHAPAVGALASLSSLQKEILTARADAISVIRLRIGGGDYSFNAIRALATPKFAVVNPGDEIEIEVSMAAYDTDKQPEIKPNQGTLKGKPANGVGVVTARATNGKMEFTGTVAITNKFGKQRIENYSTVVQVAAGGGALEMPEYLVLYQGYDNFVVPSLSGALDASLTATGCSVTKTTRDGKKGYIVKPGAGVKSVTMTVTGKGGNGKPIKGISNTYKVKRFPQPVVKVSTISKSMGQTITAGLPGDSPLRAPNFVVKSVELLLGDNNPTFSANVPGSAVQKLKVNKKIGISVVVFNPITKTTDVVSGELKITN